MSMDDARRIIREATEGIMDEKPSQGRPTSAVEYQVWALRLELQQYAYALIKALESQNR